MDFGNTKELIFFNDLRPIPGSEAFGRGGGGGGGGHMVTDFVTRVMRPKYTFLKNQTDIYIYISTPSTRKVSHAESKASHGRK